MQAVQREAAAPLAAHDSAVKMHPAVFARLDAVFRQRQRLTLTPEQQRLLERLHTDAVRAGAQLPPAQQRVYARAMQELAQ